MIALLGRPCLGNNTKLQIRIRESKEFKSSVDKLMAKTNNSLMVGSSSWLEQFTSAFEVQAEGDDDEEGEEGEEGEEKMPSCGDYIMHFLTLPWKLIFALIPPTGIFNGYPTFVISIHLLDCARQLSVMLLAISAASSTLKIVSMLLPSSLSAPAYLTLLLPRPPLLRTIPLTTLLEMLLDPMLSMSSWVLVSHGLWLPFTGKLREKFSKFPSEVWDSLSPSSVSKPPSLSSSCWPEDIPLLVASSADPSSSRQSLHRSSSSSGCSMS